MKSALRMIAATLTMVALAVAAGACDTQEKKTEDQVTEALQKCGPECHAVYFYIDLTDANENVVPYSEGWDAEITITAFQSGPQGIPVPAPLIDIKRDTLVETPYTKEKVRVPVTDILIAPANTIGISYQATAFLDAGFTMELRCFENKLSCGYVSDKVPTANLLPGDLSLQLVWPFGFVIPSL